MKAHDSFALRDRSVVRFAILAVWALLLSACTTATKYRMAKVPTAAVAYDIVASSPPLEGTLHTVIIYKGAGSWKEKALWDEYLVTVRNGGDSSIRLDEPALIDSLGIALSPGTEPWILEKRSKENWKHYREAGLSLAMGSLGTATVAAGLGGAYYLAGSSTAGAALAAIPAVVVAEIAVVQVINNKNRKEVDREFHRRRLDLPLEILPKSAVSGSLFFPQMPAPRELVFICESEAGVCQLRFDLENSPLKRLHLE